MSLSSHTPTPGGLPPLDRLAAYLYLADLIEGRRVLEVGCGDGRGAEFLARRGARRVTGIDPSAPAIEAARRHHRLAGLDFRRERPGGVELEDDSFDCIFVPDGARILRWQAALDELRRLLAPGGQLVLAAASADRPGAVGGASYYEIVDRLAPSFSPVRMIAQAPLPALSLVAYGEAGAPEPTIELDSSLRELDGPVDEGAEVSAYIALCGETEARDRPLAIVQLPTAAGIEALAAAGGGAPAAREEPGAAGDDDVEALARARAESERAREARARSEAELERLRKELDRRAIEAARSEQAWDEKLADERQRVTELQGDVERLEAALEAGGGEPAAGGEAPVSELIADAMIRHAERARDLEAAIEERQALADELADELARERDGRAAEAARAQRAEARARDLQRQLAEWRTRASIAEGQLLGRGGRGEGADGVGADNGGGPDGGEGGIADEAEARLSLVVERLRGVERQLGSETALLAALESSLRELYEEIAGGEEAAADESDGWAVNKEEQLKTFSRELGTKDAELALMHVGLSSIRERLREAVGLVRATRAEMEGRSAEEMMALMERLSERLAVYEGMTLDERER